MMAGSNHFMNNKEARMSNTPPYVYGTKKKTGLFFTLLMLVKCFKRR